MYTYLGENSGTKLANIIGLSGAFMIMIVIVVSIGPKLFCKYCHTKEVHDQNGGQDVNEDEDEVVYGEIRYPPDEVHNKHKHSTSVSNPLYPNCTENQNTIAATNSCAESISSTCERDASRTPDLPPRCYDSDTIKSNYIVMTSEKPSCCLGRNLFRKANCVVSASTHEREPSHIPGAAPHDSDNDDTSSGQSIIMTKNPSYNLDREFFPEANNSSTDSELVPPTCGIRLKHNPAVPPYINVNNNVTIKKCNSEESITWTKNPSYQSEKNFVS